MFLQQASYTPSFGGLGLKPRLDEMGIRRLLALCILMASAVVACSGSEGGRETVGTRGPSEDATAPSIVGTSPEKGATSVAPDVGFLVTFSEPMDTAGIEAAFSITPATDGTISWFETPRFPT